MRQQWSESSGRQAKSIKLSETAKGRKQKREKLRQQQAAQQQKFS